MGPPSNIPVSYPSLAQAVPTGQVHRAGFPSPSPVLSQCHSVRAVLWHFGTLLRASAPFVPCIPTLAFLQEQLPQVT